MAELDEAAIFNAARRISSHEQREAYVREACSEDRRIFDRILTLLSTYETDPNFLESPPAEVRTRFGIESTPEGPGTVIGSYTLLERIGEGGFAVVYSAQQTEPIRRQVALKVIKPGMDTQQVIARFEAERQALALMDHQGIAKVYDAGSTESGRPYFVMQRIEGEAITDFCDRHRLSTEARLRLFLEICRAVQHAHQKGIIHRDIKPTNVLVGQEDGRPVPKIIDFGVAKATSQRLTEKTLHTSQHQILGTPQYMSPEQAEFSDQDIDTRSDIYSLGVLLYELLTGSTPFEAGKLDQMGYDEICHTIRHSDPPTPSRRMSALGDEAILVAQSRQVDVAGLRKLLRGDLDWIVMNCLEKDRNHRYESADALAQDVERHLAGAPIRARRISHFERLWRWSKRNRLVAALSLTLASLVALVAITAPMIAWQQARLVDETRQQLYAKDLAVAYNAWNDGELGHVRDLLIRYADGTPSARLRDFPWYYLEGLYLRSTDGFMQVEAFAVSPTTNQVAVAVKSDKLIQLFDAESWSKIDSWPWQAQSVPHFQFSGDGRYLALTDNNAKLSVWDVGRPQILFANSVDDNGSGERPLCVSPDGSILATGGTEGEVKIWQTVSGKVLHTLTGHSGAVSALTISPDGKTLATGSLDNSLRLWDTSTWKTRDVIHDAFKTRVLGLAYDPAGAHLACGGWLEGVQIRDLHGRLLFSLPTSGSSLSFSPEGRFLAVGGTLQGGVDVWNLASQELEKHYRVGHGPVSIAFLPSGELLVLADGKLKRRDFSRSVDLAVTPNNQLRCMTIPIGILASGDLLVAGYGRYTPEPGEGSVLCWNLRHGQRTRLLGHDDIPVTDLAVSSVADLIVAGGGPLIGGKEPTHGTGFVKLWSAHTKELIAQLPIEGTRVRGVALSPTGDRLAVTRPTTKQPNAEIPRVDLWGNLVGEPELLWSREVKNLPFCIEFSPHSDVLAVGLFGSDSSPAVAIWDAKTGEQLRVVSRNRSVVRLAFSPDGRYLASTDWYGRVEIYDTSKQQTVLSELAHAMASGVAFSPDGRTMATASPNSQVKFWHVPTMMHVATIPTRARVGELAFFPHGRTLAVGYLDRSIELWHVDRDEELIQIDDTDAQ